jgi:hypothetical protein
MKPMTVRAGYVLLFLASLCVLESLYEMFVLTAMRGPQMLFFSLAHSAGTVLGVLFLLSFVAYILLFIYSAVLFALSLGGKLAAIRSHVRLFTMVAAAQLIHMALLATYDSWSHALFA